MIIHNLCIFALFAALVSASIDCSVGDSCFGEPSDCDPSTTCQTLFRFDENGNLDLYLHNFTEPLGYAAFYVQKHVDETYEYFICIPHEGQRLRAIAELGEVILVTQQNLSGVVEPIGQHSFRCHFEFIELPKNFQPYQEFFVSRGIFDEALVIVDGVQLYNLGAEYDDDEELDQDTLLPSVHHISGSVKFPTDEVFTQKEDETLTDAFREMRALSEIGEEDVEMENLAEEKNMDHMRKSRSNEDEEPPRRQKSKPIRLLVDKEDSEDVDSYVDEFALSRKKSTDKRRPKTNTKSRQDSEDEEEDLEASENHDEYKPTKKNSKKARQSERRPKSNSKSGYDDEEEESEDIDEYTPRRHDKKSRRRQSEGSNRRNSKSRDEDDEESEEIDEYTPRRYDTKKSRPSRYEEDDKVLRSTKNKKKTKKNVDYADDDSEKDEEYYDDETNSENATEYVIVVLPVIAIYLQFYN